MRSTSESMWRRVQRSTNIGGRLNTEMMLLETSSDDLATDDGVTNMVQPLARHPVTQFQLSLDQQERLQLIERWRQQDERLYPRGFERRHSSADNILEIPMTPVISVPFLYFDALQPLVIGIELTEPDDHNNDGHKSDGHSNDVIVHPVAVIVMVCGRHFLWPSLTMTAAWWTMTLLLWPSFFCGRRCCCGRNCHGLWPALSNPMMHLVSVLSV